jgi:predicted CoA-binding protein
MDLSIDWLSGLNEPCCNCPKTFFKAEHYGVVGASKDPAKFGNKVSTSLGHPILGSLLGRLTMPIHFATVFSLQVLKWYTSRGMLSLSGKPLVRDHFESCELIDHACATGLDVTPVHPKESEIESLRTVKDIGELQAPSNTSLSFITPPAITLPTVQKALLEKHFAAVWLQVSKLSREMGPFG